MRPWLRIAIGGLALSNAVLIQAWMIAGGSAYFSSGLPSSTMYAGLVADWLLLGLIFAATLAAAERGGWALRLAAAGIAAAMLIPADWLLRYAAELPLPAMAARWGMIPVMGAFGLCLLIVLLSVPLQLFVTRVLPIVLAPMIVVTAANGFAPVFASAIEPPPEEGMAAGPAAGTGRKVIWILFDEFSHRTIAESEAGGPPLPAFARLVSEAFVADNAWPASPRTLEAVPSMFTGRRVVSAAPSGHDVMLRFDDATTGAWSRQDSPFRRVRRAGFATAAVGWFHPYCDALPGQFDECAWRSFQVPPGSIGEAMRNHFQEVVTAFSWPLRLAVSRWLPTPAQAEEHRRHHAETFRFVDARAQRLALREEAGLYFAHYPVPHPPGILDLVDPEAEPTWSGYYANAVLADRAVARIRSALEADGSWSETVLVITADHEWRDGVPYDGRVPLIVKLPGPPQSATYSARVSTTALHDLLPRLVTGDISTSEELARYLDGTR